MKIKKVAVLGAGAVGSYVIWGLSSRNDIELGVIAEGRTSRETENRMDAQLTEKYTIPKYGTPEKQTLSIY